MPNPDDNRIAFFQNPKIKNLVSLTDSSKERRDKGLFVAEGVREVRTCISSGFKPVSFFVCLEIAGPEFADSVEDVCSENAGARVFYVTPQIYSHIAYRGGTEGVVAVFRSKSLTLQGLKLKKDPLVVVLENVEKPGNIGAVLRTADGAGVDAVILCGCGADLYNPNVIRSSLGAVFSLPIAVCPSKDAAEWLKSCGIAIYTAQLQDSVYYYKADMKRACAVVAGSEDKGLTQVWRDASDARLMIPMLGKMDSLNVSISASILVYEAVRQRVSK